LPEREENLYGEIEEVELKVVKVLQNQFNETEALAVIATKLESTITKLDHINSDLATILVLLQPPVAVSLEMKLDKPTPKGA
jgi:hypothetical protein